MSLDDVIDLQITVTDKAPEKPGFGVPLIAAYHTAWPDRVREYARAADLLDDGFTTSSHVYKQAQAIKSQSPAPSRFKVGRLANAYTQIIHLIPRVTTQGFLYSGTINGQSFTSLVPASATLQLVVEALQVTIATFTGVTATEDNTKVIVQTNAPGVILDYDIARGADLFDATVDAGIAADLAAIADEDNDWYGLLIDANAADITTEAAAWTEAQTKIFVPQSADWNVVNASETTDIASVLKAAAYVRTAGIWHRKIGGNEWAAAAWLGGRLVPDPGSDTWAFKTLAGISVDDLRAGEKSALDSKRWTAYAKKHGVNVTFEGRTPSGRFIDVTRFIDWLDAEIRADVFSLLINNPKVPFTNSGIAAIKGAVSGALKKGQERGGLADTPAPTVTAPTVAQTDPGDRANRLLRGVEFTARLSGALHGIKLTGTVSV